MFASLKTTLIASVLAVVIIGVLSFRIYQQSNKINLLEQTQKTLEAESLDIKNQLNVSKANNELLTIDIEALKQLIASMDASCDERVARASERNKVLNKNKYIPKKEAVDGGVLDEESSKNTVRFLDTFIFN